MASMSLDEKLYELIALGLAPGFRWRTIMYSNVNIWEVRKLEPDYVLADRMVFHSDNSTAATMLDYHATYTDTLSYHTVYNNIKAGIYQVIRMPTPNVL